MEGPPIPSSSPSWALPTPSQTTTGTPFSNEKRTYRPVDLSCLDLEKIKKEAQEFEQKHPTLITTTEPTTQSSPAPLPLQHSLASPQSMYPGPPPPYSYPSSATSTALGFTGYISPPETRRLSDDDKEQQTSRQSLPSIHEALGKDQSILYSGHLPAASIATQTSHTATSISPSTPIPRSHPEPILSGPPNPYASSQHPSPFPSEPPDRRTQPPYRTNSISEEQPPSATQSFSTREPAPGSGNHTPTSPVPPTRHSPRVVNVAQSSNNINHTSQAIQPVQAPQPVASQPNYPSGPPAYSYPPTSATSLAYPHFSPSTPWRSDGYEIDRAEEGRKAAAKQNSGTQSYSESVKRHLDIFDLETALNEIAEGSGRALEFSRHHGAKAHQAQRSGPLSALPTLSECDDMIRRQNLVLAAMDRIRDVVVAQEHARAEQRSRDEASKARQSELSEDSASFHEKQEGGGGFAGADPKKTRRGRNAPPGRCHSCNRAETPEWRRGPDGARTLCNACGLHYAKLTRKLGPKASIGSSNLRPKEAGPSP